MKKILLLIIMSIMSINVFSEGYGIARNDIEYSELNDENEYKVKIKEIKLDKNGEIETLLIFVQNKDSKSDDLGGKEFKFKEGKLEAISNLSGGSMNDGIIYTELGTISWTKSSSVYGTTIYTDKEGKSASFSYDDEAYDIIIYDKDDTILFEKKYKNIEEARKEFLLKEEEKIEDILLQKYGIKLEN